MANPASYDELVASRDFRDRMKQVWESYNETATEAITVHREHVARDIQQEDPAFGIWNCLATLHKRVRAFYVHLTNAYIPQNYTDPAKFLRKVEKAERENTLASEAMVELLDLMAEADDNGGNIVVRQTSDEGQLTTDRNESAYLAYATMMQERKADRDELVSAARGLYQKFLELTTTGFVDRA